MLTLLILMNTPGCTSDVARPESSPFILKEEEAEPITPAIERADIVSSQTDTCFPKQEDKEEFVVIEGHTYVLHSLNESRSYLDPCIQNASRYFITDVWADGDMIEHEIESGHYSSLHHMLKIDIWSDHHWSVNGGKDYDRVWIGGRIPPLNKDGMTHLFECDLEARRQKDKPLYAVNGVYVMCPGGDAISVHYPLYTDASETYIDNFYTHLDELVYEERIHCALRPAECGPENTMQAVAIEARAGRVTLYEINGHFTTRSGVVIKDRILERSLFDEEGVTKHIQGIYSLGVSRFVPTN